MKLFTLEAEVALDTTSFDSGVDSSQKKMNTMKTDLQGLGSEAQNTSSILDTALGHAIGDFVANMARDMGRMVFEFTSEGVMLASSMEEVANVVDTTFEGNSERINSWAETTKKAFGIGELSAKTYSSTMGSTLKGMGIEGENLYDMSTALVGLAGDMASFRNIDIGTAFQKILSGMTGETEPLKQLGIIMSETNLASHALAMGIEGDWAKLDNATKTQVRFNYLMQQTADMQGDFAKTSESYSNQMRLLQENMAELKLTVGESLLPVLTNLTIWFNSLFGAGEDGAETMKDMGTALGQTYATIDSTAANALALVEALAKMEEQGVDTADEQSVWNELLTDLSGTLPEISSLINDTTGALNGGTEALKQYILQWQASQKEMATMQALQNMQKEIADQATKVATLQYQVAGAQLTEESAKKQFDDLIARAGLHYFDDDTVEAGHVVSKLQTEAAGGDVYATTLLSQIENAANWQDNQVQLEQQLLAAQAELDQMNARYLAIQSQVDAILAESQPQPPAEGEKKSGEGTKGGIEIKPNFVLQVTLNGEEIAATLTPKVTGAVMNELDWKFAQITR